MSILRISMYLISVIYLAATLLFARYAIRNTRLLRAPSGHRLMAAGALLSVTVIVVSIIDAIVFPETSLALLGFAICMVAVSLVVAGGIVRAREIQKALKISLFKIFSILPHTKYYLIGVITLVFFATPVYVLSLLSGPGLTWFTTAGTIIFTFGFVSLAIGERKFHLAVRPSVAARREKLLLRNDVRALGARLDLTNGYLMSVAIISGMDSVETILSQCAEDNPTLLDGYELVFLGKLRSEPFVKNLDRIHPREREQAVFRAFCRIDAGAVVLYARLTSPELATAMVNRSFEEEIKFHGAILCDYVLPAVLFGNVLEPLMLKCKKDTREVVRQKIRRLGKDEPLISQLEIEHDGRVGLTSFYQALVPMSREERIRRTISAFSTVLESAYPIIQRNLGPDRTRDMVVGAYSHLVTEYPMLRSMIVKSRPKKLS